MLTGDGRPLPGAHGGTAPRALEAGKVTPFQSSPGGSSATSLPSHPLRTHRVSTAEFGGLKPPRSSIKGSPSHLPGLASSRAGCPQSWGTVWTSSLPHSPRVYSINPISTPPNLSHIYCQLKKNLRRIVWQVLKMSNMELPYDPASPLLGTLPKELQAGTQTNKCPRLFTAARVPQQAKVQRTHLMTGKQTECPRATQWGTTLPLKGTECGHTL